MDENDVLNVVCQEAIKNNNAFIKFVALCKNEGQNLKKNCVGFLALNAKNPYKQHYKQNY